MEGSGSGTKKGSRRDPCSDGKFWVLGCDIILREDTTEGGTGQRVYRRSLCYFFEPRGKHIPQHKKFSLSVHDLGQVPSLSLSPPSVAWRQREDPQV